MRSLTPVKVYISEMVYLSSSSRRNPIQRSVCDYFCHSTHNSAWYSIGNSIEEFMDIVVKDYFG